MAAAQTRDNPAHAIAEQFAGASQPDRVAADRTSPEPLSNRQSAAQARAQDEQRAYEEELLERARAEAEARLKADIAAEQEAARARAETNAAAKAESERQARQRAEAEQKARDAAKALAEAKARAEQDMKAEAARRAAEAEEAQQRAAAEQLARQREQEAKALSERLRAARRARADERARALAEAEAKSEAEAKAQADNEAKTRAAALERARQRLSQHAGKLEEKIEQNRRARIAAESPARPHEQVGTSAIATGSTHPARDTVAQKRTDETADRAGSGVANAHDAGHAGVEIADSHDGGQQFYLEDRGVAGEDPGGDRDTGRAADERRSGGGKNSGSGDDIGERNAAGERSATGTSAAGGNSGVPGKRDGVRLRDESGSASSRSRSAAEHEDRSRTRARAPAGYIPLARPERATVLLVMTPGRRGIRRWNKTADPMLCIEGSCYISAGDQSPARQISRRKGFGPGIALGERAGACRNQTACVFRDVDMAGGKVWMQPIDLRILRHDRRESQRVEIDRSCSIVRGRLSCRQTVESDDYRAWIVPEDVAAAAGEQALRDALAAGLSTNVSHLSGR